MLEDILNEEILKPKKKKTIKVTTLILIFIILLILICIGVIAAIVYFKASILSVTLDGTRVDDLKSIIIIEENNKIYLPIKAMSTYLGYDFYYGDYIILSEDPSKCYIKNEDELVAFTLNSNVLTKVINEQTKQIRLEEPIKEINGELCITSKGAEEAFNFLFYYDTTTNNITIQTLSYLYNAFSVQSQRLGYMPIEEEKYENKTAILDNMIILKSSDNHYGVALISNNRISDIILETKYDSIDYQTNTSDFLVTSNNKKGIIKANKETKLELVYDDIQTIINKNQLYYLVKKSNLYGLLDENGNTIIYPEYEQIGVNTQQYLQNGVTNGYVLYNQIIPVKRSNKWALFNIDGTQITEFIYDSFGSTENNSSTSRTFGVLEIPDYNLIVASQSGKYNLITTQGKGLFSGFILDSVYITISEGKNVYYIKSGTTTKELISFLEENQVEKPTTSSEQ